MLFNLDRSASSVCFRYNKLTGARFACHWRTLVPWFWSAILVTEVTAPRRFCLRNRGDVVVILREFLREVSKYHPRNGILLILKKQENCFPLWNERCRSSNRTQIVMYFHRGQLERTVLYRISIPFHDIELTCTDPVCRLSQDLRHKVQVKYHWQVLFFRRSWTK